ncbi:MAG: hypothetical protein RBG13Loki_2713 [Promethearchaeota archaeon CR_4]|nr:MAG: hypothetical protein RBG13Loki_2713 [Candidatus Lokiarchaeota archaeon CR_4]
MMFMQKYIELLQSGELTTHIYHITEKKKVKDLLQQLNLQDKYFAILIDGRRGKPEDVLEEGSEIMILPKIAGG